MTLRRPRRPSAPAARRTTVARATAALVTVAVVGVAVSWRLSAAWWVETGLLAALFVAGIAAVVDVTDQRIPDRLVVASLAPTAAVLVVAVGSSGADPSVSGVLIGAAAFALPLVVAHMASPAALGFGDVKLAGALGAALGLTDWRLSIGALCIASGLTAAVALVRRRSAMPFAPGLVAGTALALVLPIFEGSAT